MIYFRFNLSILLVFILSAYANLNAQVPINDNLSTLRAEQTDGNKIKLIWDSNDLNNEPLLIERSEVRNQFTIITESAIDGEFIDQNTELGKIYTYKLTNSLKKWEINVGFEIPRVDYRGRVLLLVEQSLTSTLQDKLDQWKLNAEGDGWSVVQRNVSKSSTVVEVKDIIKQEYSSQDGLKSLFIFGDIAVPYSGSTAYDGHADHGPAWPTDVFYTDMDESWTDHLVNIPFGNQRLSNIPGDGKYDNNSLSESELELGRVDLSNMILFPKSELELLETYLDKNNDFKMRKIMPKIQAFARDNFGTTDSGIGPAKYYPNLVGVDNFKTGSYRDELNNDSYLFAHGSGGGTYVSAQGISTTELMVTDSLQAIFASSFGSYFGDWDVNNSYLRAQLCTGTVLTSTWSMSKYNNMALGNTIGSDVRNKHAEINTWNKRVVSIQGDPTLRMEMGNPIDELSMEMEGANVKITWEYEYADIDQITHFNIYRKSNSKNRFELIAHLNSDIVTYTDTGLTESGTTQYMVRAEYLESTPSGSYYNQGIGVPKEIEVPTIDLDNDGYDSYMDCNDQVASINPDMEENPNNQVDDNCNGIIDEEDIDQDGYYNDIDCNDEDAAINPLAEEIINNGIDENCDGIDDLQNECYEYSGLPQKTFFSPFSFDFNVTICDELDGMPIDQQVKPNDAFAFDGENGRSYTFSFCQGYDENVWKAFILVFPYNEITGQIGPLLDYKEDCEYTFTIDSASTTPDILIVIKDKNKCHLNINDLTPNGFLSLSCAYIDLDEDGYYDYEECDDFNANVNPDQVEIPFNGLDDDCDESTLDDDGDQDGYGINDDCDDTDPAINPSALEISGNMIDDNCNGIIDEDDADGDGYSSDVDCDDTNPLVNPDSYDYPNNGLDDDCNGVAAEVDSCTYYFWGPYDDLAGITDYCTDEPINSGYKAFAANSYEIKNLTPEVRYVYSFCENFDFSIWSPLITIVQYNSTLEQEGLIINGLADCEISFDFPYDPNYPDILVIVSEEGQCIPETSSGSLTNYTFYCEKIDEDNDGFYAYEDCNDLDPFINPAAEEICDGLDNNCDGNVDENFELITYYLDEDSDGFGDNNKTIDDCQLPENYAVQAGDCDDSNPEINPDQTEIPYNGIDDDCNPETRDDDIDEDGFLLADDCDDNDDAINPNQTEVAYNGIDDDCNPLTLDDDLDQDGFLLADDCNDNDDAINPNQTEVAYNGKDDDCNPMTLDDDLDQDGFLLADDCNDNDSSINPDAEEIANNDIDENCDGNDLMTSAKEIGGRSISIFPNPANHQIFVDFEGIENFSIALYDLLGNLIITQDNIKEIQVSDLPQGQYLFVLIDTNTREKIIDKIVIAH